MREAKFTFAKLAAVQAASAALTAPPAAAAAQRPLADRRQLHAQACACLELIFSAVRTRSAFALPPAAAIVRRMAAERPVRDELFIEALHRDEIDRFALHHSVNVAVYAIKMAQDLGFNEERQVEIGLAGLLHDVGIALLPEQVVYKKGPLTAEELDLLRERPNSAWRILQCLGPEKSLIAECAAQVYERADGSGYPRGLAAEEIHEYAQIIGLLDLYEALVHSRPNREKLSFFEAVKYICKSCKAQFRRRHLKSLLRVFTVFPLDSYVQLNSEAIGKVVETVPDQPMRPKLQIILDSQRREVLAERIIALTEAPLLNIARGVPERELHELRKGAAHVRETDEATCDTVKEPVL